MKQSSIFQLTICYKCSGKISKDIHRHAHRVGAARHDSAHTEQKEGERIQTVWNSRNNLTMI
jgi:hypothetical protein